MRKTEYNTKLIYTQADMDRALYDQSARIDKQHIAERQRNLTDSFDAASHRAHMAVRTEMGG